MLVRILTSRERVPYRGATNAEANGCAVPSGPLQCRPYSSSLRLEAQDVALSRLKHGFESRRERQQRKPSCPRYGGFSLSALWLEPVGFDGFAGSESGQPQAARRARHRDVPRLSRRERRALDFPHLKRAPPTHALRRHRQLHRLQGSRRRRDRSAARRQRATSAAGTPAAVSFGRGRHNEKAGRRRRGIRLKQPPGLTARRVRS